MVRLVRTERAKDPFFTYPGPSSSPWDGGSLYGPLAPGAVVGSWRSTAARPAVGGREPLTGAAVRTDHYKVFVVPEGDCHGLYVAAKSQLGFTVRELQGTLTTVPFSYSVSPGVKTWMRHGSPKLTSIRWSFSARDRTPRRAVATNLALRERRGSAASRSNVVGRSSEPVQLRGGATGSPVDSSSSSSCGCMP